MSRYSNSKKYQLKDIDCIGIGELPSPVCLNTIANFARSAEILRDLIGASGSFAFWPKQVYFSG